MVTILKSHANVRNSKVSSSSKVKTKKISPITKKKTTMLESKVSSLRVVHKKPVVSKAVKDSVKSMTKIADSKKPAKSAKNSSKIFQNRYIGKSALHHEAVKKIEQIWNIINEYSEKSKSSSKKPASGVKTLKASSTITKIKPVKKKVIVKKVIAKKVLNNKNNSLVKQLSIKRVK